MGSLDIRKKVVRPSDSSHSKYRAWRTATVIRARAMSVRRTALASGLIALTILLIVPQIVLAERQYWSWAGGEQSAIQNIRVGYLNRYPQLPLQENDPKLQALIAYLQDKKSPLVKYAGELSRLPNWKVLLGIAQAESNLCKKTNKNNCWGIGPNNTPLTYNDISESLYYANYLMNKYDQLGMNPQKPETIVKTYVGYEHPGWVNTIHSVFYELAQRGLN
ncbi:MAG TPA: hypothetical protein VJK50_02765 [Patescibacteria group bacterium]|nr:hypothetical protein [Patescibacteria group bacterium]